MAHDELTRLVAQFDRFDHAMLVTRRGEMLRSRPMAIADHTEDGRIRFITRDDSAKLAELEEHDQVNVAMQSGDHFLSISGHARATKDRALIDRVWQQRQAVWFAEGREDPHVIVLEVIPTFAEYWDRSDVSIIDLVRDSARAAIGAGQKETVGADVHGRVDFRNDSA